MLKPMFQPMLVSKLTAGGVGSERLSIGLVRRERWLHGKIFTNHAFPAPGIDGSSSAAPTALVNPDNHHYLVISAERPHNKNRSKAKPAPRPQPILSSHSLRI